jgi:glucosamine 6-phosphate synthetase-like amidotransferase/phosphosugar isomerase protein
MGAAEMKHGPIALIDSTNGHEKTTVVFLWILNNETFPYLLNALDQMHSRNAYVVVITDCLHLLKETFDLEKDKYNQWKEHLLKEHHTKS